MDMQHGQQHGHTAGTCSIDKQHSYAEGHAAWRQGHEACMIHGLASLAYKMDIYVHLLHAEWTWHDGQTSWTSIMDMQHRNASDRLHGQAEDSQHGYEFVAWT
jgi:hypothetical protein